ncbi:disulfide bond formation protein B [Neisseria leonii]|uniref:disulfide bond formation protein B n=1 Tax=Neisseria leonii TaxID=2995413 RepID=UPI00237AAE15|nr:disulfide bond formation protein B [Neisseria sp. 3986]MDD9324954.1 disulfide bond formation protein B [Neisseria sp. 3986]
MDYRRAVWTAFVLGALCTAGSFFAQYVLLLNPCPLCILQRLAVMAVMLVSGVCLLLPLMRRGAQRSAAVLISIPAVWGVGVAVYQLWLQSLPDMERPSCGAPWTFRLRDWPLFDVWEPVVRGMGDCASRTAVLGVPLPVWTLLFAAAVLAVVWGGLLCRR